MAEVNTLAVHVSLTEAEADALTVILQLAFESQHLPPNLFELADAFGCEL